MESASRDNRTTADMQSRDETDRAAPLPSNTTRAARDAKKLAKQQVKKKQANSEREVQLSAAVKVPTSPLQSKADVRAPRSVPASEPDKLKSDRPLQNVSNTEKGKLEPDISLSETTREGNRKYLDSISLIDGDKTYATDIKNSNQPDKKIDVSCKRNPTQKTEPAFSTDSGETKGKAELRAERRAQQVAQKAAKKNAQPSPQKLSDAHSNTTQSEKSKAQLRAERRALQEAQRAAKATAAPIKPAAGAAPAGKPPASKPPASFAATQAKIPVVMSGKPSTKATAASSKPCAGASWFRHLEAPRLPLAHINGRSHPSAVRLATQMCSRVVRGSNARVVALLHALQQIVADYAVPARTDVARGLEAALATSLAPVWAARPPSASMVNAVKHLRALLTHLPNNISEFDAKCQIKEAIDTYLREQIQVAGDAISLAVRAKISTGDLVLTYGCSSLVEKILVEAWRAGVEFRVLVVGARHNAAGRVMLRRLVACGVRASYVDLAAIGWAMRRADKVVMGAGALLANGWVLSAAGTACVSVAAHAHNVPVLVACETHKFSERVQTDAFVYNEVSRERGRLSLTYDVTPPALVAAVVTELAVLPCTSAPVVLRFKLSEYTA